MENENNVETVHHHKKDRPELTAPMATIIAGILISASILIGFSWISPKIKGDDAAKVADTQQVNTKGEPFVGNAKAKITVAYWYDYQCPFCKRAESSILSPLLKEFVDSGKVKVVFKGMQFLGEDSTNAGIASYAVWEVAPAKFLAWHQAMFGKQDAENGGWGNKADISALTKEILGDVDASAVENLIATKSEQYKKIISDNSNEASSFGVNGTPAFMVNNEVVKNLQSYPDLQKLINILK